MRLALKVAAAVALVLTGAAHAAEPVKRIDIYVEPYYAASPSPDQPPRVAVGAAFETLLASTNRDDIVAARDKVLADPRLVTPMTMMVLAIRLYDMGLRDDAVFWFYAAKDRYRTLAEVLDLNAGGLRQVEDTMRSFMALAGPVINGYAFCDIANQQAIRARALDWVEANPYGAIQIDKLPAVVANRDAGIAASVARIRIDAAKETAYLEDATNVAAFKAKRAENEMDVRFCWK